MNKILMSLAVALASWTLMPTSASALPGECGTVCKCTTSCATKCTAGGGHYVTTCGAEEAPCGGCADDPDEEVPAMGLGEYSEEDLVCRLLEP